MASNVIQLPRPTSIRPSPVRMGHYLHIDWSDHREVLQLIAEGERGYLGFVISAISIERHKELINEARQRGFDIILDPKTQQSALQGSFTSSHSKLPWGLDRPHVMPDFLGEGAVDIATKIAKLAIDNGFTQILAPTHILTGFDDPWFGIDIDVVRTLRKFLPEDIQIIYPISVPMSEFRNIEIAKKIAFRLSEIEIDGLWLRIENFGTDASGDKSVAYIKSAAEFEVLGVPIIADHVAGLVGLSLMAFGVVGGIAHGVMLHEGFRVSNWRLPPKEGRSGGLAPRVYVSALDMMFGKEKAQMLLEHSTQTKGHFGCQDPNCCPKGIKDTLRNPARHYLRQRAREVEHLSSVPSSLRAQEFMDKKVRRVSDSVAAAASLSLGSNELAIALGKRQKTLSGLRMALSSLADTFVPPGETLFPPSRDDRKR